MKAGRRHPLRAMPYAMAMGRYDDQPIEFTASRRRKPQRRLKGARVGSLVAAGALVLLISGPAPSPTEAKWVDPEHASANVTALTVPSLSAPPTCETLDVVLGPRRKEAKIVWKAPEEKLSAPMRYEIRTTNTTAEPTTTKSIFLKQGTTSHTYSDPTLGGLDFKETTTLEVQVLVVIPDSQTNPTRALWESPAPPAAQTVTWNRIDISRGSYRCAGD
ncbi:MAG: hypothetical protein L0H61_08595, partial [Micrococcaceae bacterium]|nr:hypothetical protein [Micrococcaceae bacterium]